MAAPEMISQRSNDLSIYNAAASAWWDGSVSWIRTLHNMVPARLRFFERSIPVWSGLHVLDLGCAGGFLAEAIARRGGVVSGIDPAEAAIGAARAHAAAEGLRIDYRVGVGERLPWADHSFDVVACVDVLEHVSDLDQVLSEMRRVLQPGGWFAFDTINRTFLASFAVVTMAERVLRLLPRGAHDPALFIKPSELGARLERHGFDVGPMSGLGPIGINARGDFVFGRAPTQQVISMGVARLRPES